MAASEDIDLELIAAFMDGRLKGAERERAIKLLRDSEAAFEVYADALRARADLGDSKVVPIETMAARRRPLAWRSIGSVAAAAALLIAVLPSIQGRRDRGALNAPSSQIALALTQRPDLARSLPADWDQPGWSVTRGLVSGSLESSISFRLGVRALDFRVALAVGDTVRSNQLVAEILNGLERVELSDDVKAQYAALRRPPVPFESRDQLLAAAAVAEQDLADLFPSFWFAFGRWIAGGELAASTRSKAFFDDAQTIRFLKLAAERSELSPDDAELLRQIAVLAEQGVDDGDFDTIRQNFRALIRRHGG